jgi:DNA-binding MarR family transcriptional regulator
MNSAKTLHQFNIITDEIDSLYHKAAGKMGLSDSEMLILYLLVDYEENISQSDIIAISGMSKQTVNSAVTNMEKKNWLKRAVKSGRKRSLELTETGRAIVDKLIIPFQKMEESIFDSWSMEDRSLFVELNIRYRDALKDIVNRMSDR